MPPSPQHRSNSGFWLSWSLFGIGIVLLLALLSATQQWAELRDTPKHMSWLASFLYQGVSWVALGLLVPVMGWAVWRWPLDSGRRVIAGHVAGGLLFAMVFLLVAIPVRGLFHPAPVLWELFGAPFYKSAPQWFLLAVALYGVTLVGWSYLEARGRFAEPSGAPPHAAPGSAPARVSLAGTRGELLVDPGEILWIRTGARGATLAYTNVDGTREERLRHTLAELEERLGSCGMVRVHRSYVVNPARVREVRVPGSRDGTLTLDTGDEVPVSRRRSDRLRAALASSV